tara:strand:+ start:684 stop:1361 length:678 start_codon:yes stop_codon:yes gene_type:complete
MFNKIWDQSSVNKSVSEEKPWSTEKELILYMIDKSYGFFSYSGRSEIYDKYALKEWKNNSKYFDTEHSMGKSFRSWDSTKLEYLADHCDDADILRAVFESGKIVKESFFSAPFVENVNLPDDIIIRLCKKYSSNGDILKQMQTVEYKYITEETKAKIPATIAERKEKMRKKKEDKTKKKLTAFLTTAAATKSVLTGNSIDDVVEQTITSDVDDVVLDYMNKLFDK